MPDLSRRNLIRHAAVVTGAAVVASATPATGALARTAARRGRRGDIRDIKHVVILMQENRSFDHYFGSLKGVRGFGDRSDDHAARRLPGVAAADQRARPACHGHAVPVAAELAATFSGTQPPSPEVGAQNYGGTDHSWETSTAPGTAA